MYKKNSSDIFNEILPKGDILSESEVTQLKTSSKTVSFEKKDVIFRQGTLTSHVMFLESGLVKLSRDGRNDKSIILKIVTPGHFISLVSIFGNTIFDYSATAINNSKILFIDIITFNSILENNGKYSVYLLKNLCQDTLSIFDRLTSQYQKQLPGKIANIILYFSENIFYSETFEFPLTRNELADLAGTTKESFIRTLTEFKNDKIIELDGKFVKIKSAEIIKTLSRIG